jgi:drug/metabolite transporter (DMT)-like permease
MRAWLALAIGIVACSTAVILIKASHTPPVWLAAERLLLAAAAIAPLALRDARRAGGWGGEDLRAAWWPACFLAAHFATWVVAARLIPAANSTLVANFTPVVMPVVALVLLRERVSGLELAATLVGIGGVMALAVGDLDASSSYLLGDGLCFVAMLALAVYLALARRLRRGSLWLYMAPVFAIAGVICAAAALAIEGWPRLPGGREALLVIGLALVPTVVGHSLMNRAMGELRPQVVSLAALGNVPCAALMAWVLWREAPSPLFWVTCAAYIVAVTMLMWPALRGWFRQAEPSG